MRFRNRSAAARYSANARWRAAEARAQAERDAGIPDLPLWEDGRQTIDLDLRNAGYRNLRLEPRLGYVAWRAVDADTGEVVRCAAIKELLRWIAGQVPRMLGPRHWS
jgi:hypothetical protein